LKSAGISEKEGISSRQINEPSIECKNKNSWDVSRRQMNLQMALYI
jgi:hypothetical protein